MKNVFDSSKYHGLNPIQKIKKFFRDLKFCYQRITRGWCESDTWNMDTWFLEVIPPMLNYLRKNTHGHPCEISEFEWDNILCNMEYLFKEADENQCGWYNQYKKEFDEISFRDRESFKDNLHSPKYRSITRKYLENEKRKSEYMKKCKDEAFELFSKWFYDLWD